MLLKPTSTKSLSKSIISLVKTAGKQGRPLKIRASHTEFGSMAPFPCPSSVGNASTSADSSRSLTPATPIYVGVVGDKMRKVLSISKANKQVRVQAGIQLEDLLIALSKAGLSIPRSSLPWWAHLTVAGSIATTAHGSGYNAISSIVSRVTVCATSALPA